MEKVTPVIKSLREATRHIPEEELWPLVDTDLWKNDYYKALSLALARKRHDKQPADFSTRVDIVIPVYNAAEYVRNCLESLEKVEHGADIRVVMVNDGSDEQTTAIMTAYQSRRPQSIIIHNNGNIGYTRSVNRGLKTSSAPYVILMNSDVIVTSGWLGSMLECMRSDASIGIVGPLSNAGGWQNIPILRDEDGNFAVNKLPMPIEETGRLVRRKSLRIYPKLPFINGFCFMIKREVLDAIGYMDEENFPIGYGEEDDFCIRAGAAGFALAVADDSFVYHAKTKTFRMADRRELTNRGITAMERKHGHELRIKMAKTAEQNPQMARIRANYQKFFQRA